MYFPQGAAGKTASAAPADLHGSNDQGYSFKLTFDASPTARGNLAYKPSDYIWPRTRVNEENNLTKLLVTVSLTPKVRFSISVLRGNLISGNITAGITNTIQLGVSASSSITGNSLTSTGFCYWAFCLLHFNPAGGLVSDIPSRSLSSYLGFRITSSIFHPDYFRSRYANSGY